MCEILRSNFTQKYPEIISALDRASFIGLDTELTGISIDEGSLFDTAEQRYQMLKEHASKYLLCQLGLSMFIAVPNENRYEAVCYNIYLFPYAQGVTNFSFSCLGSCIEFLCQFGFDFNKLFYEGVPYMNRSKEQELRKEITKDVVSTIYMNRDELKIVELHGRVAMWLLSAKEGDTMEIDLGCRLSPYIVHVELRTHFLQVWTHDNHDMFKILVEKVSDSVRKEREKKDDSREKLVNSFLGFSRIFNHIIELKKPIVGHNLFFDLLMIYQHFYKPLPRNLAAFKKELHSLFPVIYDTKHIVYCMHKDLEALGLTSSSSLNDLFKIFSSEKGRLRSLYSPTINFENSMRKYLSDDFFHEAGFDSYMAGYVFLRLAHFCASKNISSTNMRPFSMFEYLHALKSYENNINLIRAQVDYINLKGNEPANKRPPWLIVQSKNKVPLNLTEVASLMSQYGNVDLRLRNHYEAFLAVNNFRCAREIIKGFSEHEKYRVSKYNIFRHLPAIQALIGTSAALSGGIGIWMLWNLIKQSRPNTM